MRVGVGEAGIEERDGDEEKECGEQCASIGTVSRSPARAPQHCVESESESGSDRRQSKVRPFKRLKFIE